MPTTLRAGHFILRCRQRQQVLPATLPEKKLGSFEEVLTPTKTGQIRKGDAQFRHLQRFRQTIDNRP